MALKYFCKYNCSIVFCVEKSTLCKIVKKLLCLLTLSTVRIPFQRVPTKVNRIIIRIKII